MAIGAFGVWKSVPRKLVLSFLARVPLTRVPRLVRFFLHAERMSVRLSVFGRDPRLSQGQGRRVRRSARARQQQLGAVRIKERINTGDLGLASRDLPVPCSVNRLNNRVPLHKGQTASRRSVEIRKARGFTMLPFYVVPRSRLFGSHQARSQAGTTSVRGCYRSRRWLLPYASRRNALTRVGSYGPS